MNILQNRNWGRGLATVFVGMALTVAPHSHAAGDGNWVTSIFVESVSIDSAVADREGVDDGADAIGLMGVYRFTDSILSLAAGLSFLDYDDNREFTQLVEEERLFDDDRIVLESSDANAGSYFIEFGPEVTIGESGIFSVFLRGGYSDLIDSERTIEFCDDCREEDIDIEGGAYGNIGVNALAGNVSFGLSFRKFSGGDIDDAVRVSAGYRF